MERSGEACAESLVDRVGVGRAGSACDYFVNNACQPRAHATTLYTKMPDTLLGTGLVSIWAHRAREGLYVAELCTRTRLSVTTLNRLAGRLFVCRGSSNRARSRSVQERRGVEQVKGEGERRKWRAAGIHRRCPDGGTRAGNCRCVSTTTFTTTFTTTTTTASTDCVCALFRFYTGLRRKTRTPLRSASSQASVC